MTFSKLFLAIQVALFQRRCQGHHREESKQGRALNRRFLELLIQSLHILGQ